MSYQRRRKENLVIDGIVYKYCKRCGNYFPLEQHFYFINDKNWGGITYRCKQYERGRTDRVKYVPREKPMVKGEIKHGLHNSENPHGEVEEAIKVLEGMGFEYGGEYPVYYQFLDRLRDKYGLDIGE